MQISTNLMASLWMVAYLIIFVVVFLGVVLFVQKFVDLLLRKKQKEVYMLKGKRMLCMLTGMFTGFGVDYFAGSILAASASGAVVWIALESLLVGE